MWVAITALLCVSVAAGGSRRAEDPLPALDPAVQRAALEHHVRFLASDELRGRGVGTPESRRVSAYLAAALERAGVAPAGEKTEGVAGWYQLVPLLMTRQRTFPVLRLVGGAGETLLEFGPEFSVDVNGDPRDTGELRLLVVRELDELPAQPDPGVALVMHRSRARSFRWLEERGHEDGAGWGLVLRVRPTSKGRAGKLPRPRIEWAWKAQPDGVEVVTVNGEAGARLWEGDFERVQLSFDGSREKLHERNVVGMVEGVGTPERPELAREVLVLSAHFDHMGEAWGADSEEGKDTIYNGADDDASGTAALLELAEAFAHGSPPARSVVFLFCAAEEMGMVGTKYWVDAPTVPLEAILCNLNLEMLGMPDPASGGVGRPWLTGYERSNLGELLGEHGVQVEPDPHPKQSYFTRSDNIVFVRKGIVGQTLSSGGSNPHYHRLSDEADTLDFEHLTICARTALAAARLIADGTITPEWKAGEPDLSRR